MSSLCVAVVPFGDHCTPERLAGVEYPFAQRPGLDDPTQNSSEFIVVEPFDIAEHHDLSLSRSQPVEGPLNEGCNQDSICRDVGTAEGALRRVDVASLFSPPTNRQGTDDRSNRALAKLAQGFSSGNGEEPRGESIARLVAHAMLIKRDPRLLDDILGRLLVLNNPIREAEKLAVVEVEQPSERRSVSFLQSMHQPVAGIDAVNLILRRKSVRPGGGRGFA